MLLEVTSFVSSYSELVRMLITEGYFYWFSLVTTHLYTLQFLSGT
jgi:hypothetical protein